MRYRIEVLSPVHVGSGEVLTRFDYVWEDGWLYVLSLERILEHPKVRAEELAALMERGDFDWGDYLRGRGIKPPDVARYRARCARDPAGVLRRGDVREHIKDPRFRPYIPGSSIKGAIRTALLWVALKYNKALLQKAKEAVERRLREVERRLAGRKEWQQRSIIRREKGWFAQRMERGFFGRDPNYDLMRAVRVGDTTPFEGELEVGLVTTYDLKGQGRLEAREDLRIFAELLPAGATAEVRLTFDKKLFDYPELGLKGKEVYVDDMPKLCNAWAFELAQREEEFLRKGGMGEAADFYRDLRGKIRSLPEGAFIVPLGWGPGWEAKTVGERIKEADEELFARLREIFKLGSEGVEVFPKTRRLVGCTYPLGWVLLTLATPGDMG